MTVEPPREAVPDLTRMRQSNVESQLNELDRP